MKRVKILCIVIASAISFQSAKAQTVDEIIGKYETAMGGKDKMLSLKTVKMTGNLGVQGIDVGIVVTAAQGIGTRTDISVPGMGEGFQIMSKSKGWNYMPFQGQTAPQEVPADQVKTSQSQLDIQGPLVNYMEKGSQAELLGKEIVDGSETYKIKLTNKEGKVSTYFIDAKSFYRIKSIAKVKAPEGEMDMETSYSDFKKTEDGYIFPFSQTNPRGTIVFSSIEVNKPVDEKIFQVN